MLYVMLIVYAGVYGSPVIATQEFSSNETCEAARQEIYQAFKPHGGLENIYLSYCQKK